MKIRNILNKTIKKNSVQVSRHTTLAALFLILAGQGIHANDQETIGEAAKGLTLRSIGPALMGGRISDIEIHPTKSSTWYVAAGSGGLWKTINAGTTWKPIFDSQVSYSIGDIAIDPNNPDVIWIGSGENVSGRHVAWGDGVYKSTDAGKTWTNMGLKQSEHIGKILVGDMTISNNPRQPYGLLCQRRRPWPTPGLRRSGRCLRARQ